MELDRLEVVFDGDLDPFDEKLAKFEQKLDSVLGRVKSTADRNMGSMENSFNGFKGFDKFNKQTEKMNATFEKQMNRMNQTATKQGEAAGSSLSSGFSKGTAKLTKDVQTAVDKVNLKMQQAKAAQSKLTSLTSDRNGAKLSGDNTGASKFEEQMAKAQIQMNRAQSQAQSIVRGLRAEYDAIPQSLSNISAKMEGNERLIESMRAKVKSLNEEMKAQQTETGSFSSGKWRSTGTKDTPQSSKTAEAIAKQSAKVEKLIADNDALQRAYAQLEDRSGVLKAALGKVNTELGEMPIKTRMASNGIRNLSGSSKQSEGIFSRFKNTVKNSVGKMGSLFSHQSKQVTSGTSRMSQGMGGFGRSMRMLWSQLFLFTFLYQGIMALAGGLYKALQTNTQFSASLNQIKVNLLTAFYPIYQAALPAINTLMSGLAKITGYIASFISTLSGMNIGEAFSGAQGLMNNVQALENTGTAAADASDGYDDMVKSIRETNEQLKKQHDKTEAARKATSKFKQLLMGFDEIHTLDFDNGSDDFEKQEFTPQEIPDRPKATKGITPWADFGSAKVPDTPKWLSDFANKFKSTLAKLFDPIKQAWDAKGQLVMDSWKYALSEVGGLIKAVGKSFMDVWTNGTGTKFIGNMLILLSDMLSIVGDVARAFKDAWKENDRGTKLLQQVFDTLNQWLIVLHDIALTFRDVWNNGTGVEIAKQLLDFFTNICHLLETIGKVFKAAWDDNGNGEALIQAILSAFSKILKLINLITKSFDAAFSSGIGESILSNIFQIVTNIFNVVGNLAEGFRQAWNENSRGQSIFEGILGIINTVLDTLNKMTGATSDWAQSLDFTPLLDSINDLLQSIQPLTKNIGDGLSWFYQNVLLPLASFTIENIIPDFLSLLSGAMDVLNSIITTLQPLFQWLWDNMLQPIATWTGGVIVTVLKDLGDKLTDISNWIDKHQKNVQNFAIIIGSFASAWGLVTIAVTAWNVAAGIATVVTGALGAAIAFLTSPIGIVIVVIGALVAAGILIYRNWDTIKAKAGELKSWLSSKWNAIGDCISGVWDTVCEKCSGAWDTITNGFGRFIDGLKTVAGRIGNSLVDPLGKAINGVIGGVNWVLDAVNVSWRINKWNVPQFANGTNYHHGGPAIVNDGPGARYREMFKLPNGQLGMFPRQRNMLVDLPRGTQVLPANQVPQYKGGVFDTFKDFFTNGFDRAKGIADDVWSVISDPSQLVDMAMDKFVSFSGMLEPMFSIANGVLSNAKNAVVDFVIDTINSFTGFSNGGMVDRFGWYQMAEGNNPEMVIPMSKPELAMQRINEALDFMGVGAFPELTMPDVFRSSDEGYSGFSGSSKRNSLMTISGNGMEGLSDNLISSLGDKVASAIIMAISTLNLGRKDDGPVEVILEVDSTRLGEVVIKGINKVTQKTGVFPLNV